MEKYQNWLNRPFSQKLRSVIYRFYSMMDHLYEKRMGLDFDGYIPRDALIAKSEFALANATAYSAANRANVNALIRQARKTGHHFDGFIDIGSGKGKVCIHVAREFNFKKIIGIDFSRPLVDAAEKNLSRVDFGNVRFFCADATEWQIPGGNHIVFLFNPFNEAVLEKFLKLNMNHFKKYDSVIAYYVDAHRSVLARLGFKTLFRSPHTYSSLYKFKAT